MPKFTYKAKKGPSEIVQGEIDAESEDAALGKISVESIPVRLRATTRVSYSDLGIFTRQFAILLRASVPLLRIFEILQFQTRSVKFRQVLTSIQEELRQGASLSEALAQYPKIFSQIYVNMIHSGEVSGTLDKVLSRLAEFAETEP